MQFTAISRTLWVRELPSKKRRVPKSLSARGKGAKRVWSQDRTRFVYGAVASTETRALYSGVMYSGFTAMTASTD